MSTMVEQVNSLIADLLAGGGELYLPEVGTLYTERSGARRISRNEIQPPLREVMFSEQQDGVSLVAEIARTTGCDEAEAKEVYERWLSHTRTEDALTIEGVGVLSSGEFKAEPAFDTRLNPHGREPMEVKSACRFDWVLWIGIAAIMLVLAIGVWGYFHYYYNSKGETAAIETPVAVEESPADDKAQDVKQPVKGSSDTPASFVSGRHYAVIGVYSTVENARRAAAQAAEKNSDVRFSIYYYGDKFVVSPFETDDEATAVRFIRGNRDRFIEVWIYTAH